MLNATTSNNKCAICCADHNAQMLNMTETDKKPFSAIEILLWNPAPCGLCTEFLSEIYRATFYET